MQAQLRGSSSALTHSSWLLAVPCAAAGRDPCVSLTKHVDTVLSLCALHSAPRVFRYRSAGKDYVAAVPVLDSRQRLEQLQRLHLLQQQQQEVAAAAAAAEGGQQPPQQAQAAADAVTSTLSAVLRHKLQPAPQYATPGGTVHWSVLQYREAVQQAEEAAAAAASAAEAPSKKRSAAAAGLGDRPGLLWGTAGSSSSKRFALADFGLSGSAAGEQWWYLPGTASEAEQVGPTVEGDVGGSAAASGHTECCCLWRHRN